jgi:RNA polymerase sigma-70 factor, ECF subfamily
MSLFDSSLLRRGEELEHLLEFYRPYLLRLAEAWIDSDLRPRFAASDAVQQTMFAAAVAFEGFQGATEREFRKWLVTILRNQLVDGRRLHKGADKRDLHREERLELDQKPGAAEEADVQIEAQESIERLLQAIEQLPETQRSIVRARYLEGRSFEEIARARSVSREWVRRRWKEAIHALGRRLRTDDER